MTPEAIKEIGNQLKPLAEKVGQLGGNVFELAIRNNYVTAASEVVYMAIYIISIMLLIKNNKKISRFIYDKDLEFFADIGSIALAVVGIILLFCISDVLSRVINPQWSAIQDIANLAKAQ